MGLGNDVKMTWWCDPRGEKRRKAVAAAMNVVLRVVLYASLIIGPLGLATIIRLMTKHSELYTLVFGWEDAYGARGERNAMLFWYLGPTFIALAASILSFSTLLSHSNAQVGRLGEKRNSDSFSECDRLLLESHARKEQSCLSNQEMRRAIFHTVASHLIRAWVYSLPILCTGVMSLLHGRRHRNVGFWDWWTSISLSCGWGGLVALMITLLPLSRSSALLARLGIDLMAGIGHHRLLGHMTLSLLVAHGSGYAFKWWWQKRALIQLFKWNPFGVCNLSGLIALASGIILWISSTPYIRRRKFRWFYRLHAMMAFAFLVFGSMHYTGVFYFLAPPIVLLMIDLAARARMNFHWSHAQVKLMNMGDSTSACSLIRVSVPLSGSVSPLQFAFINIPEISKVEWHPFSLVAMVNDERSGRETYTFLRVCYGNSKSWSARLKRNILEKQAIRHNSQSGSRERSFVHYRKSPDSDRRESGSGPQMCLKIQGPYAPTPIERTGHVTRIVLVGGGTGVVPLFSYLSSLVQDQAHSTGTNVNVIWCIKHLSDLTILSQMLRVTTKGETSMVARFHNMNFDIYCTDKRQSRDGLEAALGECLGDNVMSEEEESASDMRSHSGEDTCGSSSSASTFLGEQFLYTLLAFSGSVLFMILAERAFHLHPDKESESIFMHQWFQGLYLLSAALVGMIGALLLGGGVVEQSLEGSLVRRLPLRCGFVPTARYQSVSKKDTPPPSAIDDEVEEQRNTSCLQNIRIHCGRPDLDLILQSSIGEGEGGDRENKTTLCLASGPPSLVESARLACMSANNKSAKKWTARLLRSPISFHPISFEL